MKKFLLLLAIMFLFAQQTYAIVVVAPYRPPEKPPVENCFMQLKVNDGQWRCYTKTEWEEFQTQESIRNAALEKESKQFWDSKFGMVQFIVNIIVVALFFVAMLADSWVIFVITCTSWIVITGIILYFYK